MCLRHTELDDTGILSCTALSFCFTWICYIKHMLWGCAIVHVYVRISLLCEEFVLEKFISIHLHRKTCIYTLTIFYTCQSMQKRQPHKAMWSRIRHHCVHEIIYSYFTVLQIVINSSVSFHYKINIIIQTLNNTRFYSVYRCYYSPP